MHTKKMSKGARPVKVERKFCQIKRNKLQPVTTISPIRRIVLLNIDEVDDNLNKRRTHFSPLLLKDRQNNIAEEKRADRHGSSALPPGGIAKNTKCQETNEARTTG